MSEQKPVVAAYQYQFDGPYGPVWRNDSGPWNGQTPIATRELYAAPQAQPAQAQPARLSDGDIEKLWTTSVLAARVSSDGSALRNFAHAIAAAVVPQGFVVVPEEPTEAMVAAWPGYRHGSGHEAAIYRARRAAAKATK